MHKKTRKIKIYSHTCIKQKDKAGYTSSNFWQPNDLVNHINNLYFGPHMMKNISFYESLTDILYLILSLISIIFFESHYLWSEF